MYLFALIERVFRAVLWCSESVWRLVIPRPGQAGTAAAYQHSQPVSKHIAVSFVLFADLKGSPRLCYPWGCMEVAAKDKQESFPFLLGLRNSVLCVLFFLYFFFTLSFNEMHKGRRKSKFNYKAISSSLLCLSGLGSAIISPLMQEWNSATCIVKLLFI